MGKGAYSKVKLAKDSTDNEKYAIKIHKSGDSEFSKGVRDLVITEVKAIMKLQGHPNIIQIKEFQDEANVEKKSGITYPVQCVVVEELAQGGELFYFVLNSGCFSEKVTRYYSK